MKEVIKKVIDFYKENVGTRWLIKDIIVSVLLLTIPAAATVVGLVLHLTWLIIVGAVLYFISTSLLIMSVILCLYFAIEVGKEMDDILYGDDADEEDATETKTVFHVGDRVRAIQDHPFYKRGMEGFVENIDNVSFTGIQCIKVSLIDPLLGRLSGIWTNGNDFELSDYKEDA